MEYSFKKRFQHYNIIENISLNFICLYLDDVTKTTQKLEAIDRLNSTSSKFFKKEEPLPQVTKNIINVENKGSNQPLSGNVILLYNTYPGI